MNKNKEDNTETLVKQCLEGNRKAQTELFERYRPRMAALCRSICMTKEDAEDAVMEAFGKMFEHLDRFYGKNGAEMYQWLKAIVMNQAIGNVRKSSVRLRHLIVDPFESETATSHQNPAAKMDLAKVSEAIETQLSAKMSTALVSSAIDGRSCKEVAKKMGLTENHVKVLVFRAREKLANILPEYRKCV